jgi:radical SAM superfamily enzyme YgiQ (UPF0313 family)
LTDNPAILHDNPGTAEKVACIERKKMNTVPKILFTSVFGPYGVDDDFGRKENIMELFHNQVTREQGVFSLRYHHQSFGLYMIAENIRAETTILDFPSRSRFVREIRKNRYDYIGISFIVPNFSKARHMAELIREHAPDSKIILGGHGTTVPELEQKIQHDHICRGEGIRFMRNLLGDDPDRPLVHPIVPSAFNKHILGIPIGDHGAVLMPGVGCPNACRFCCTSHFYNREYTAFLKTGRDIFDVCERAEREHGITDFFVMDENFLKYRARAEEFLEEMERNDKHYTFAIFSSAETVRDVGIEFMKRLGVVYIWIGMEGRHSGYEKNKGVDFASLVAEMRNAGIAVLGSVILFTESHTKETIHRDIDFAIEAGPDFIQFMQLGPLPGTALYKDLKGKGLMRDDIPYEEWHGQHRVWFRHPVFSPEETESYLRRAFQRAWDEMGCSLLRYLETSMKGYLSTKDASDTRLGARNRYFERTCRESYPALHAIRLLAHNRFEREYADETIARYHDLFGAPDVVQRMKIRAAQVLAAIESARMKLVGNLRQPKTLFTRVRPACINEPAQIARMRNVAAERVSGALAG